MNCRGLLMAVAAAVAVHADAATAFKRYPLYKQCDPAWGNTSMGVNGPGERSTICGEGCAMSSLAMALAGQGAAVDGALATPATLNAWLEDHNGYVCLQDDCNNLNLTAVTALNSTWRYLGENQKPSLAAIRTGVVRGDTIYIAHIPALVSTRAAMSLRRAAAASEWARARPRVGTLPTPRPSLAAPSRVPRAEALRAAHELH